MTVLTVESPVSDPREAATSGGLADRRGVDVKQCKCRACWPRICHRCGAPGIQIKNGRPLCDGCRDRQCTVIDCGLPELARGHCSKHYVTPPGVVRAAAPRYVSRIGTCAIDNCDRPISRRGWCGRHYAKWKRYGDPLVPSTYRERGTGSYSTHGYVRIWDGRKRRRPEHVLVMQRILGRDLLPGENVHHKNGVRHDNRPENLELWVTSQPSGQRPRDLVAWAREVIDRYSDLPEGV